MITALLIAHGLLAVALLGALTHQAVSVLRPSTSGKSFVDRYRGVNTNVFSGAVVVLFMITALGGGLLYPAYRVEVRTVLEDLQLRAANGVFEAKEHFVAVGLGLLPAYALFWRAPLNAAYAGVRRFTTVSLAAIVWWSYLVGHVLNNIRGLQ